MQTVAKWRGEETLPKVTPISLPDNVIDFTLVYIGMQCVWLGLHCSSQKYVKLCIAWRDLMGKELLLLLPISIHHQIWLYCENACCAVMPRHDKFTILVLPDTAYNCTVLPRYVQVWRPLEDMRAVQISHYMAKKRPNKHIFGIKIVLRYQFTAHINAQYCVHSTYVSIQCTVLLRRYVPYITYMYYTVQYTAG